jgi:integration host factor subunit alpha
MPPVTGKTLTRADLAEAVFEKVRLPRNEAAELVELVLKQIVYALERGESIKLSSFGSFGLRQKSERVGRNPKTGEVVPITPRRVIIFKASNIMKERINAALSKPAKPAEPPKSAEPEETGGKPAKSAKQSKAAKSDKANKAPKPEAKQEKTAKASNSAKPANSSVEKKRAVSLRRGA